jgi:SPP1 gp7 family putative phage head morphogenesis protein
MARARRTQQQNTPTTDAIVKRGNEIQLASYKAPKELTWRQIDTMRRNSAIWTALRNTKDQVKAEWRGAAGYTPQSEETEHMKRDPQVMAASESPSHQLQADLLRWNLDHRVRRGWSEVLGQIALDREDGKSVNEILWRREAESITLSSGMTIPAGLFVIHDILSCRPEEFGFRYEERQGEHGSEFVRVLLYDKDAMPIYRGKPVDDSKFIVSVFDRRYENDEGESILTKLHELEWYWRNNFTAWMVHLHRYGSPVTIGKYPVNATADQQTALLNAIDSIQQETGVIIPEDQQLEFLEAMRGGSAGFEVLHKVIESQIAMVITGHSAGLSNEQNGTLGQAQATTATLRKILLYSMASRLDEVINHQLIYWWMRFNFPQERELPRHQIMKPPQEIIENEKPELREREMIRVETEETTPQDEQTSSQRFAQANEQDMLIDASREALLTLYKNTWVTPVVDSFDAAETTSEAFSSIEDWQPDTEEVERSLTDIALKGALIGILLGLQDIGGQSSITVGDVMQATSSQLSRMLAEFVPASELSRLVQEATSRAKMQATRETQRIKTLIAATQDISEQDDVSVDDLDDIFLDGISRYGIQPDNPYHVDRVLTMETSAALAIGTALLIKEHAEEIAYLRYITMDDSRVRPTHQAMHMVTRPADDPIWSIWWPPNGYNCRCRIEVIPISRAQGVRRTPVLPDVMPDEGFVGGGGFNG